VWHENQTLIECSSVNAKVFNAWGRACVSSYSCQHMTDRRAIDLPWVQDCEVVGGVEVQQERSSSVMSNAVRYLDQTRTHSGCRTIV
jgi:hypothetical protein